MGLNISSYIEASFIVLLLTKTGKYSDWELRNEKGICLPDLELYSFCTLSSPSLTDS